MATPALPTPLDPPAPGADNTDDVITVVSTRRPGMPFADLRGRRIGPYVVEAPIGLGGMGAVFRATDVELNRPVALKLLPPAFAGDPEMVSRFRTEARAAALLDHENVARVFGSGEADGFHFIAYEFVDGATLRDVIEDRGRLTPAEVAGYLLQAARGLAHAAAQGVTHRDLKPSNVVITPDGRVKIVDMGLARCEGPAESVTQSGVTLGSFDYMAPEQAIDPRSADARSDIYSLGCTAYHALTGRPPVPEGTAARKLQHHQQVRPPDPRQYNRDVPDPLLNVLARMMAKEPGKRFQSPAELVASLESFCGGPPVARRLVAESLSERPVRTPAVITGVAVIALFLLVAALERIWPAAPTRPPAGAAPR
jgi:serine/threonine protein kinase